MAEQGQKNGILKVSVVGLLILSQWFVSLKERIKAHLLRLFSCLDIFTIISFHLFNIYSLLFIHYYLFII